MLGDLRDAGAVAEITLQPVRRHGVDAAILYSDIVVPLRLAGVDVDIVPGWARCSPRRCDRGRTSTSCRRWTRARSRRSPPPWP
ncbi:MAG: uroporphyrinogen decarboxylase family protein [Candidatus Nanopelagicales bacterium]